VLPCETRNKKNEKKEEEKKPKAKEDKSVPVLQEIADALKAKAEEEKTLGGGAKELKMALIRKEETQAPGLTPGEMDPALWRVGSAARHLEIRWSPGLDAGSLDRIGALSRILHLAVQDSKLPALPESLCELKELRSLEVDGNNLTTFPKSIEKLASHLESISAARNKLNSGCLPILAPLEHLVTLKLDSNKLVDLEDLDLHKKPHLRFFSVAQNNLTELPEDPWGDLVQLEHLNVSENKITELPCEMGAMKEKKLTELLLHENPWKDGKIRNFVDASAVTGTVLVYLRKQAEKKPKSKGKAKGKPKRKPKAGSDSEAESDEAPAAAAKEDDSEEEPEEKSEKKKKKKGKK